MQADTHIPTTAKLFWNGKSQAVRLPKAFRFNDTEVVIRKQGKNVILSPRSPRSRATSDWDSMLAALPELDDDFMRERPMNRLPKPEDIF